MASTGNEKLITAVFFIAIFLITFFSNSIILGFVCAIPVYLLIRFVVNQFYKK